MNLAEWLSSPSIAYLSECLQYCENPEMLSDLRAIAPAEALREAAKRLSPTKRQQLKMWVEGLNAQRQEAA